MRTLLIEDDRRTARAISRGLTEEGYVVDVASSGEEGEDLAVANEYAVIVLDWYLPGKDGLTVCRDLRARGGRTPILMLTARDGLSDRVTGLNSGADDYLTKPFAFEELLARLRALVRRSELGRPPVLRVEDLTLDPVTRRATRGAIPIELTAKEYQILEVLMRHAARVVTRTELEVHVWGEARDFLANAIDVHLSHLRRKIDHGQHAPLIHTVRGCGYYMGAAVVR
jgi:DNA-binding response OmpR family regulator